MSTPIVIVASGGLPVTEATNGLGMPVSIAANGFGIPVTLAAAGGMPVVGSGGGGPPAIAGLFNFNRTFLSNWRAARASTAAGTANSGIAFVGDSVTAGFGGSGLSTHVNDAAFSFPSQLVPLVPNAKASSIFGSQNLSVSSLTLATFDSRVTETGTFTQTSFSLGGPFLFTGNGALTFKPANNVDTFKVIYAPAASGGVANLAINGGATTPINMNGAAALVTATQSAALGSNTLDFSWASGGNIDYLGIIAFNSAVKEVSLYNAGSFSAKALDFDDASSVWSPLNFLPALAPQLTFIDLTINDWNAATNLTSYQSQLQAVITAAKLTGDCVLLTGVPSDPLQGFASDATQQQYTAVVQSLAVANNCVGIDFRAAWGTWASANANGWMFDGQHPSGAGYLVLAQSIAALLNTP